MRLLRLLSNGRARIRRSNMAVGVVPTARSGFPLQLYVTLGPFWVPGSVGGHRENRVLDLGRGRVLGVVTVGIRARSLTGLVVDLNCNRKSQR
ncbi:hypothetical protein Taro_014053 [Colocasia esculenta]|uniref:Uncharacterized protein n=1 Tax=Colocasia esculenta TaxID=4460 RepID=A0A843UDG5_COLES|nr:hypothetical protein [Colocasia esculenta]